MTLLIKFYNTLTSAPQTSKKFNEDGSAKYKNLFSEQKLKNLEYLLESIAQYSTKLGPVKGKPEVLLNMLLSALENNPD